jgi:uncharacterized protein (DUF1501 family)
MQKVARLISSGVKVPIIKVSQGSFDTHANQLNTHRRLLKELAEGLKAFQLAMQRQNLWGDVLLMTYSEFGRRAAENGSRGTDHGTAAPHFMMGGRVKGGLYGLQPSLYDLQDNDLRHQIDYREIYSTVLNNWWALPGISGHPSIAGLIV